MNVEIKTFKINGCSTFYILFSFINMLFVLSLHGQNKNTHKINISVSPKYEINYFQWAIAGNSKGTNPNIYSELIWKKLQSVGFNAKLEGSFYKRFIFQAELFHSYLIAGKVTDTDYKEDNRKKILYTGEFSANKGKSATTSLAIGYKFMINKKNITPLIGYSLTDQILTILPKEIMSPPNLYSTYRAHWKGIMVGYESAASLSKRTFICFSFRYNQLNYSANANWNLISQFRHPISFEHKALGFGIEPSCKLIYSINNGVSIYIRYIYSCRSFGKGTDILFLSNGQIEMTQLVEVKQTSFSTNIGINLLLK